jgi:hypothetical protein
MTDLKKWSLVIGHWSLVIGHWSLGKSFSLCILLFASKCQANIVKLPSFINQGAKIFSSPQRRFT